MKIAVIGYSGSGKSTLAAKLGQMYEAETLHLDTVQFLPGWEIRSDKEKQQIIGDFLNTHQAWVIDGNYSRFFYERRMEEADAIIMLLFRPLDCLRRVTRRYKTYRDQTRPDMAEGCNEKLDWKFVKWVLWQGRTRKAKKRYANVMAQYPQKVTVIRNQKQLDRYMTQLREKSSLLP